MAETFRKARVESFCNRLSIRKKTLKNQLLEEEFQTQYDFIRGQISAIDLILEEIKSEFLQERMEESE